MRRKKSSKRKLNSKRNNLNSSLPKNFEKTRLDSTDASEQSYENQNTIPIIVNYGSIDEIQPIHTTEFKCPPLKIQNSLNHVKIHHHVPCQTKSYQKPQIRTQTELRPFSSTQRSSGSSSGYNSTADLKSGCSKHVEQPVYQVNGLNVMFL